MLSGLPIPLGIVTLQMKDVRERESGTLNEP
jgi:hypothetical protein